MSLYKESYGRFLTGSFPFPFALGPFVPFDGPAPLPDDEDSVVDSRALRLAVCCRSSGLLCWGGREGSAAEASADSLGVSKSLKGDHSWTLCGVDFPEVDLPGVWPDCLEGPAIAVINNDENSEVVAVRGSSGGSSEGSSGGLLDL